MRALLLLAAASLVTMPLAGAVHFYRSTALGCIPSEGALGDPAPGDRTVMMLHNTYIDSGTLTPVTLIQAGQRVTWVWSSAHCHSATSGAPMGADGAFDTGFRYPIPAPESPQVLPGLFEYPIFDLTPALSYTQQFNSPGVFPYFCVHHAPIGMVGVVVVQ